jgi:hypothetical protein
MTTADAIRYALSRRFGGSDLTPDEQAVIAALERVADCSPDLVLWAEVLNDAAARLDAICDDCGRDTNEAPHTAECLSALRQDAADGDEEARAILAERGEARDLTIGERVRLFAADREGTVEGFCTDFVDRAYIVRWDNEDDNAADEAQGIHTYRPWSLVPLAEGVEA